MRAATPPLTAAREPSTRRYGREIHPPLIRLTISVLERRLPGRIAASGECAADLLNSTLPGAFRIAEGHCVSGRERQRLALRLDRTNSGGVAGEGGEGEQDSGEAPTLV